MQLVKTVREQVKQVAERWDSQYVGAYGALPDKLAIKNALSNLNVETATALDVKNIIGNDSWVIQPRCDECGAETDECVIIGGDQTYHDNGGAVICVSCLRKATKLIEERVVSAETDEEDISKLTDRELLEKIYWGRGYCSIEIFYEIEKRMGGIHPVHNPSRYDPSPNRDPDALYQEIKHLQRIQTTMQNQLAKVYRELKEKR